MDSPCTLWVVFGIPRIWESCFTSTHSSLRYEVNKSPPFARDDFSNVFWVEILNQYFLSLLSPSVYVCLSVCFFILSLSLSLLILFLSFPLISLFWHLSLSLILFLSVFHSLSLLILSLSLIFSLSLSFFLSLSHFFSLSLLFYPILSPPYSLSFSPIFSSILSLFLTDSSLVLYFPCSIFSLILLCSLSLPNSSFFSFSLCSFAPCTSLPPFGFLFFPNSFLHLCKSFH